MTKLNGRAWRPAIGRITRLLGGEGSSEGVMRARGRIARALVACPFEYALVPPELVHIASRKALYGDWPGVSSNGDYACLMGLLAAYELRKRNTDMEMLMIENTYLLGRFYALVEQAEIDSLQARGSKVSTAPVTRLKKGVYTRPRWGFQQLDDRFEVAIRRMGGQQQGYYRKLRTEILGQLAAEKFALTSVDGNLFLIGAQHEARRLWRRKPPHRRKQRPDRHHFILTAQDSHDRDPSQCRPIFRRAEPGGADRPLRHRGVDRGRDGQPKRRPRQRQSAPAGPGDRHRYYYAC